MPSPLTSHLSPDPHLTVISFVTRNHKALNLIDIKGAGSDRLDLVRTSFGIGLDPLDLSLSWVYVPLNLWKKQCTVRH